jgi:hypothetical protein
MLSTVARTRKRGKARAIIKAGNADKKETVLLKTSIDIKSENLGLRCFYSGDF